MKTFDLTGNVITSISEAIVYFSHLDEIGDIEEHAETIIASVGNFAKAFVKSIRPDLEVMVRTTPSENFDQLDLEFLVRRAADGTGFVMWTTHFNNAAFSFRDSAEDALNGLMDELNVACRRIENKEAA